MEGVLLEREANVDALEALLGEVERTSRGRLALIAGEAGVGKTTLVHAFCRAHDAVWTLAGACDPLGTPRPLGPLLDIADEVGGRFAETMSEGSGPAALLAGLAGGLRRRSPAIVVLEDLHWADEGTLDFLRFAGRRMEEVPALVIATFRDDELDRFHPLRIALGELPAERTRRLSVDRLSEEAVAILAHETDIDADALYRRTGGNPFFVTEVLASKGADVPETVRDAVLSRVAHLTPEARALLEAVAIIPSRAELDLLEAIAPEEIDGLDECLRAGMLEQDGQAAVRFRHEIARATVDDTLPPRRAIDLHRRALGVLTAQAPEAMDLARVVHHADAAGDGEAVLRYAPVAADRAEALGANREAAQHSESALRHATSLAPAERATLLGLCAHRYVLVGRLTDAVELGREAADAHGQVGDRVREGDSLSALVIPLWTLGRGDEAETAAADAIAVLEGCEEGPELARAYAALALLHALDGDPAAATRWGRQAAALAERVGDERTRIWVLVNVSGVRFAHGDEAARVELERNLTLAQAGSMAVEVGMAFSWLAFAATRLRRYELASEYAESGIDYCERFDLEISRPYLIAMRGEIQLATGDWDDAADSAAAVLRTGGVGLATVGALAVLGRLRARRADPGVAPLLDEALALANRSGDMGRLKTVAVARCEAAWLDGRNDDALAETDRAWALVLETSDPWLCGELGDWRARVGARDDALPDVAGPYELARKGDWCAASDAWTELGCPYESALALVASSDEADLRRALAVFQELGAVAAATLVSRGLRELGARDIPTGPRAATRENPAGLTPREVEVLGLVAEGLRNAEIAAQLFVSERTVGHHVSSILGKLGVKTRGQASAEAARLGLL